MRLISGLFPGGWLACPWFLQNGVAANSKRRNLKVRSDLTDASYHGHNGRFGRFSE